jgi:hypothetical protein
MTRSESIAKLLPALIRARSEFPALIKDSANDHFKSRYADLAAVLDACDKPLGKHDLGILQSTDWTDGKLTLRTMLCHSSGEWMSSDYPIVADYTRPQQIGAALTYARRYQYMAVAGIAPEDDDGETASGRGHHAPAARPQAPEPRRDGVTRQPSQAPPGWGSGYLPSQTPEERAAAVAAYTAKPANGHGHANGTATKAPPPKPANGRRPVSGRDLWRWAAEIEKTHGPGLIAHMLERARGLGLPERMVSWGAQEVPEAYQDACDCMEVIYDVHDDEPDGPVQWDDAREH